MDEQSSANLCYPFGENVIWCKDNCISGRRYYIMFVSFLSYTVPFVALLVILFLTKDSSSFLFTKIFLSILYILEIYSTLRGGCTDPGIIPKQYLSKVPEKGTRKCVIRGKNLTIIAIGWGHAWGKEIINFFIYYFLV